MNLATDGMVFEGLNKGEEVDFTGVKTVEELINKITENYVTLCRKCAAETFCKYYDPSEPPCPLLAKVVSNYVHMNLKSVNTEIPHHLAEFIKSVILLIEMFNSFTNWQGIYVEDGFNWFFEGTHPKLNSFYARDLILKLGKFISAYRVVSIDRIKNFVILVEGPSEYEALPPIFRALHVFSGPPSVTYSVKFIPLKGKDSLQKDKIETILSRFREEGITYFLILDNDPQVSDYTRDLTSAHLIEDGHYLIWDSKFEDNFREEAILKILKEEDGETFNNIDLKLLVEHNTSKRDIGRSIDYLLHEKGIHKKFDDYKIRLAKKLSEWVCREIEESQRTAFYVHGKSSDPSSKTFPCFVEKLRRITDEIKRIRSEFHSTRE